MSEIKINKFEQTKEDFYSRKDQYKKEIELLEEQKASIQSQIDDCQSAIDLVDKGLSHIEKQPKPMKTHE